ncbi:MAG: hypothetical protein A2491_19650 [Bacteroidetes bacterium RIFOXYC12_FULL_35_7]|nr:MAG: hypothetical protein A2491_19650 [Bacteroidetes bacterium RIFOXYC12_FULL_35_7]
MKNKKLRYILLPLVLIVWGLVFYKVYEYVKEDPLPINEQIKKNSKKTHLNTRDTILLVADYRDPFLGKIIHQISFENSNEVTNRIYEKKSSSGGEKENLKIKQENKAITKTNNWPTVIYSGIIINQKNSKKTALLKINNKEKMVSEGEIIDDMKIEKIYPDSLILKLNDGYRNVLKNSVSPKK